VQIMRWHRRTAGGGVVPPPPPPGDLCRGGAWPHGRAAPATVRPAEATLPLAAWRHPPRACCPTSSAGRGADVDRRASPAPSSTRLTRAPPAKGPHPDTKQRTAAAARTAGASDHVSTPTAAAARGGASPPQRRAGCWTGKQPIRAGTRPNARGLGARGSGPRPRPRVLPSTNSTAPQPPLVAAPPRPSRHAAPPPPPWSDKRGTARSTGTRAGSASGVSISFGFPPLPPLSLRHRPPRASPLPVGAAIHASRPRHVGWPPEVVSCTSGVGLRRGRVAGTRRERVCVAATGNRQRHVPTACRMERARDHRPGAPVQCAVGEVTPAVRVC